ncbi:MAG: hypothetical protein U5O16_36755 [Rhodococcus sp. (in: high G+C Gram-positive bacteria)]|uniref:hypothetical protein n=1 Tax=Rhodococcus sp. TaxID=1831 RepID=UPI002AD6DC2A|nr:hypothetical protein [Rhodococcus sp. (in: high G+C Gram-positive bacteria)]
MDGVDFAVTVGYRRDSGATELVGYVLPHVGVDLDVDEVLDAAKRILACPHGPDDADDTRNDSTDTGGDA